MARYILVAVDDNGRADKLIEKLTPIGGVDVIGLFAKPQRYCTCSRIKEQGYTWGQRLGWWVCTLCGRPSRGWGSSAQAVVSQAKNLLMGGENNPATIEQTYTANVPVRRKRRRY